MADFFERFIAWFNRLGESAQIDEVVADSVGNMFDRLQGLSTNQQLVLLAISVSLIVLIYFLLWVCKRALFRIRGWYRRKRIPSDIDLHLDADREDLKYGENLRQNMKRMRKHAPFKNRD